MSTGDVVRVVVVDDQPVVRSGFGVILNAAPAIEVVGEAADGREAVDLCRRLRPDVTLMDIRMPVLDGLAATRLLAGPDVVDPLRVLVLTTFDLDEYVYDALRAGASGFLLKDATREALVEAVKVVARGDALLDPVVTRRLIGEFAARRPRPGADADKVLSMVTAREREVLELIARGATNGEIAGHLTVGEATVKTHVGRLFSKLGLRDRVQAVILAYEIGLVTPGDG
jgi:DNA-binding NarL/FixJ family response regulator